MSLVIKGGTIVAADRTYKADVLVEGETIKAIGANLKGDSTLDARGLLRHAGRHRSAHPSRHAVHGHEFGRQLRERHQGRALRRHDDGGRLLHPQPRPAADGGLRRLGQALEGRAFTDYAYHMCITYWSDKVREDMAKVVAARRDDLQAFHGLQGRADGQRRGDVRLVPRCAELGAMPLVHAENGDVVAALQKHYLAKGITGPEGHALSRPPEVEGEATNRAIMLADQAGVPLYIVHTSCIQAHEAIARARAKGMRVYGEPLIQHLVLDESEYYNKDWEHAARRVMSPPFRDKKQPGRSLERPARRLAASGRDRPLRVHHRAEGARPRRLHQDPERHRRPRGPHAGAVDLRRRHRAG